MFKSSVLPVLFVLGFAYIAAGCAGANSSSEPESRSYATNFDRVIVAAADATRDAGLSIESAKEIEAGRYQIIASKYERLRGEREPIRVADIEILVRTASGGAVSVDIEQSTMSRTSTIGTSSSEQIDYPRRIYKRLERRLKS